MSANFGNAGKSSKRALRLHRHLWKREISEFAGDLLRIEEQSQICGRYARCNGRRLFLHVIRNEPVVLFGAILREITPRKERATPEEVDFFPQQFFARHLCWA